MHLGTRREGRDDSTLRTVQYRPACMRHCELRGYTRGEYDNLDAGYARSCFTTYILPTPASAFPSPLPFPPFPFSHPHRPSPWPLVQLPLCTVWRLYVDCTLAGAACTGADMMSMSLTLAELPRLPLKVREVVVLPLALLPLRVRPPPCAVVSHPHSLLPGTMAAAGGVFTTGGPR